jgi:DNA-binding LacI/PurR family transcriptional regulator
MRASIRQVSELAKVSAMTVSRVLRGRDDLVSPDTRERVLKAVRELDYIPVRFSAQNRHVETRIVGLVPHMTDLSQRLDLETLNGIADTARGDGYDVLLMLRGEAEWMADRQDLRFLDRRCDGFIFVSVGIGEWRDTLRSLVHHKVHTVVCYRRDVPEEIAWIDADNEGMIRSGIDYLVELGHRRIAYISPPPLGSKPVHLSMGPIDNYDHKVREAFFIEVARQMGVFGGVVSSDQVSLDMLRTLISDGVTAIIAGYHSCALRLWDIVAEGGIDVPRQLSLIGIDHAGDARARGLTTIGFGFADVGQMAVKAFEDLVAGNAPAECCRVVESSMIVGQSCAPPR